MLGGAWETNPIILWSVLSPLIRGTRQKLPDWLKRKTRLGTPLLTQKGKYCMISLPVESKIVKCIEAEARESGGCQGQGRGVNGAMLVTKYKVSVKQMNEFWNSSVEPSDYN